MATVGTSSDSNSREVVDRLAAPGTLENALRYEQGRSSILDANFDTSLRNAALQIGPLESHDKLMALAYYEQWTARRMLQESLTQDSHSTSLDNAVSRVRGAIAHLQHADPKTVTPPAHEQRVSRLQDLLLSATRLFEAQFPGILGDKSTETNNFARALLTPEAGSARADNQTLEHAAKCEVLEYLAANSDLRGSAQRFIIKQLLAISNHLSAKQANLATALPENEAAIVLDQLIDQFVADCDPQKSTSLSLATEVGQQRLNALSVGRALSIGRHGLCDLVVEQGQRNVSRFHMTLIRTENGWGLLHLGQSPVVLENNTPHVGEVTKGQWVSCESGTRIKLLDGLVVTLP